MGLNSFGSDLNPVAGLLTWAALNINGASNEEVAQLREFQGKVYNEARRIIDEWGLERNEKGWLANAYLYCFEATCPECNYSIPLSSTWQISAKNDIFGLLIKDEVNKTFQINIKENATKEEIALSESQVTIENYCLKCPNCKAKTPIPVIRKDQSGEHWNDYRYSTKNDLRFWSKTDYYPNPIKNINFKGSILNTNGTMESLNLNIQPASFLFEDKPFYLTASLNNFEDINYDIKAKGELDIAKIYKVFSQKGLDLEGYANADVSFKGKQSDATKGNYNALQNKGTLELRNIKTTSTYLPQAFVINNGLFTFNQDKMNFTNFNASYGTSTFLMNGYMENVINFALSENEILKGNFSVSSNYLNVDEFLTSVNENDVKTEVDAIAETTPVSINTGTTGVIVIPKTVDFNLNANVKKVDFQELKIDNLIGNLQINQGTLSLNNVNFGIIGSTAKMRAKYKDETLNKADFDFAIKAEDFDIKKAYTDIKMFREMASAAENAEGIVSLDYKVKGKLDGNMTPIYPSLSGGGTLSVKNVKMKGFKMFNVISKETATDAFKDADLSKVNIKTTIKNNIINIEQFRFRVAGFRTRIEGQTSFDGNLNIKMRLGLPPLGIIGIPIKVTGTQENPNVKIGKKTEDLEETEYDESDLPKNEPSLIPKNVVPNNSIPNNTNDLKTNTLYNNN